MPARDTNAPAMTQHAVVAQLDRFAVDQHFPVLVSTTKSSTISPSPRGSKLRTARWRRWRGVVFRYQEPKNYYVLVASVLDKHFWFFKIVDGVRSEKLIGPAIEIAKNEWHEMSVKCEGNHIHCLFDGKANHSDDHGQFIQHRQGGILDEVGFGRLFHGCEGELHAARNARAKCSCPTRSSEYPKLVAMKIFAVRPGGTTVRWWWPAKDPKDLQATGRRRGDGCHPQREKLFRQRQEGGHGDGDGAFARPKRRCGRGGGICDETISRRNTGHGGDQVADDDEDNTAAGDVVG